MPGSVGVASVSVPDQVELRRRIRAAMALADVSSWEDLADRTGFSRSLLKDLGTERGTAEEKHLRVIAAATGVPYSWFTVPDLAVVAAGAEDATLAERVEALERQGLATRQRVDDEIRELRAAVAALSADSLRRTRELQELRDRDRPQGRPEGGGRG